MIAASAFAAISEVAITHPIDSAKVRAQTGRSFERPTAWAYRGIGVRLAGVLPMRIVFWSSMDFLNGKTRCTPIAAGALAGVAQTFVDTPIESAKIMRMTGSHIDPRRLYRGFSWNAIRNAGFAAGVSAGKVWSDDSALGAAAGAVCGAIATHPFDTLKSRAQAFHGLHHRPPATLWSGLGLRCALSFSTMFVGAAAFEFAKRSKFL